jgi:photosystem II stability/assembly factor-like uncharacterized protein
LPGDDASPLTRDTEGGSPVAPDERAKASGAGDAQPVATQPEGGSAAAALPSESPWINLDSSRPSDLLYGLVETRPVGGVVTSIRVDPRSADVIYVATSDGGVWKSTDFTSAQPNWIPLTDDVGRLTIGAMDLDPQHPDTLYVGLNDVVQDGMHQGIFRSVDGGAHWGPLAPLNTASQIQDLMVDPSNSSNVLVATDRGLFRSVDSGASFALVALTNANGASARNSMYSLAYVGATAGKSVWMASGQCRLGCSNGDLWRSTDSGATWTSLRGYGGLPVPVADVGRMTVRAGHLVDPTQTVLYALADRLSQPTPTGNAVLFRSTDGGAHFTLIADAPLTYPFGNCNRTSDVISWRGNSAQALVIDPTDANHVLIGGQECSIRSLNGLAPAPQFAVSSDWLGPPNGPPYVHYDWHAATASVFGGLVRVYSGTTGGLASSTNLWTTPAGREPAIAWRNDNGGMNPQVGLSVASGDPMSGNPEVILSGLQDNGYLLGIRQDSATQFFSIESLGAPTGKGTAIGKGTLGQFFWAGLSYCAGSALLCGRSQWTALSPPLPAGDSPGDGSLSAVQTEPSGATVLLASQHNVWRSDARPAWTLMSGTQCDPDGKACTSGSFANSIRKLFASQTTRGLYAVGFYENRAAVTSSGESANPTWSISAPTPANDSLTAIAFPTTAAANEHPGDTYVVSTRGDGPAPDGHLFITHDRGRTWASLHGTGSGADLPNVAVRVVRFDPSDATNRTLYAGLVTGVYRTIDAGSTWRPLGAGLPAIADISDIYVARDGSFLRVAVHGRGLWEYRTR